MHLAKAVWCSKLRAVRAFGLLRFLGVWGFGVSCVGGLWTQVGFQVRSTLELRVFRFRDREFRVSRFRDRELREVLGLRVQES